MKISIDVIIPSFRLDQKYIVPIIQLTKPPGSVVKFYIIVDNPSIDPPASIRALADAENIFLIINKENLGASETRNKGISSGSGDWILFLDDDIVVESDLLQVYADGIIQNPGEIGFIGLVNFPEPTSAFTRAIKASGSMDIFKIALRKKSFAWGATANTVVNRAAIGSTRFLPDYPKSGGGEDVDFFLKVRQKNNYKDFKTLPLAIVHHPWWNKEEPDFRRPYRYGKGNSRLGDLNPEYTFYDFFNTPEIAFISLIGLVVIGTLNRGWLAPILVFIGGILLIEIIASAAQTFKRSRRATVKVIFYVMMLRLVQESGVLAGKLSRLQLWRIGERFHDNGTSNKFGFFRLNTYKTVKWILYPLLIFYIFLLYL